MLPEMSYDDQAFRYYPSTPIRIEKFTHSMYSKLPKILCNGRFTSIITIIILDL